MQRLFGAAIVLGMTRVLERSLIGIYNDGVSLACCEPTAKRRTHTGDNIPQGEADAALAPAPGNFLSLILLGAAQFP